MHTIDDRRRPLLLVSLPPKVTGEWFVQHGEDIAELIRRDEPYALVYDLEKVSGAPDAGIRKHAGDLIAQTKDATLRLAKGVAFVSTSPLLRGALKAVFWVQPMPAPQRVFAQRAEAVTWCEQRLGEAGLVVPGLVEAAFQRR